MNVNITFWNVIKGLELRVRATDEKYSTEQLDHSILPQPTGRVRVHACECWGGVTAVEPEA